MTGLINLEPVQSFRDLKGHRNLNYKVKITTRGPESLAIDMESYAFMQLLILKRAIPSDMYAESNGKEQEYTKETMRVLGGASELQTMLKTKNAATLKKLIIYISRQVERGKRPNMIIGEMG